MTILKLIINFFILGAINIGGGLSLIPLISEVVEKNNWMTQAEIVDMVALSQMAPGPIGIKLATYAGFSSAGVIGGVIASLSMVVPSVIIIIIIAHYFEKFKNSNIVKTVMIIIRPLVTGMIAAICLNLAKINLLNIPLFEDSSRIVDLFDFRSIIIAVLVFIAGMKFKVHPIILIVASAIIGIIIM